MELDYAGFKASGSTGTNYVQYSKDNLDLPGDGWNCTCEDFYYRKRECKHIREAKRVMGL